MALPAGIQNNTTCDIYRSTSMQPPGNPNPDVGGVPIYLTADYAMGREHNESDQGNAWTHTLVCDWTTDIRDSFSGGVFDYVYIPDKTGTKFMVRFVVRKNRTTNNDCKIAYIQRQNPTWPTNNL
jgi:hypothetical protein